MLNFESLARAFETLSIAASWIKRDDVIKVYSSKRGGCWCGCRGSYSYPAGTTERDVKISEGNITRVLRAVRADLARAELIDCGDGEWCMSVDTETRSFGVYFRPKSVAQDVKAIRTPDRWNLED